MLEIVIIFIVIIATFSGVAWFTMRSRILSLNFSMDPDSQDTHVYTE